MPQYYLAVDIGASSGRHILGWLEDGKLRIEEVYRFQNGMTYKHGHLCWDIQSLFDEILNGLAECRRIGKQPAYMGVDTWAVDFVLLDKDNHLVGDPVGYRDGRTAGMDGEVYQLIPEEQLYEHTGIQKQIFNTVYQLMAVKQGCPYYLKKSETFLMIPDYFHFLLTGTKTVEYTNATTTQLVTPKTNSWDWELIHKLGYPEKIFPPISYPGDCLGPCLPEVEEKIGYQLQVLLPATHDTASAVVAVPSVNPALYISSGTWSLMGVEQERANCTGQSRRLNFTNEGGYGLRFRYLKNIMGLWMIQSVKMEWGNRHGFAGISKQAEASAYFPSRVPVNDSRFLAPDNMADEIKQYCRETGQPVPETVGETAAVIYQSLAESYCGTINEIEQITGYSYPAIHIVGGGAKDEYLNRLTAQKSGLPVYAGPVEATAIGNLAAQMLSRKEFASIDETRKVISSSFGIVRYDSSKAGEG